MRRLRWCSLLLFMSLFLSQTVAQAAIIPIEPRQPTAITDNKDDIKKITALQRPTRAGFLSSVSPDDKTVLTATRLATGTKVSFMNISDGATLDITTRSLPSQYTNIVWRDANTAIYFNGRTMTTLNRNTGAVGQVPAKIPAKLFYFPLSLSPNSTSMLVEYLSGDLPNSLFGDGGMLPSSQFNLKVKTDFDSPSTALENESRPVRSLNFASNIINLGILDTTTGQLTSLIALPEGSSLESLAWSTDGSKLALTRITFGLQDNLGFILSSKATQDGLGQLPPDKNPFFNGYIIDTFDFKTGDFKLGAIKAADGNGDIFQSLSWSTDGKTLMVQMASPGHLASRPYPTYIFTERTYLRFYNADLQLLNTFESPEIETPLTTSAAFIAPDEVLIAAAKGTNLRMYYYNRVTGIFSQITSLPGTVEFAVATSNQTRQVVFRFSSFTQTPELYRLNWDGSALFQLTFNNGEINKINQVRADEVSFTLSNGQQRTGYIIQAADAPFPPSKAKMVVWQEGGPGPAMLNSYNAIVERPFNLLPSFGLALLFVPLSGREGYGPAFYNALSETGNFGKIDIDEGAEIVKQSIARGYTSAGSVGVTGCSYGGYFTSQSITRYPNLYAAANTQCSLLDLLEEWQFGITPRISYHMGMPPTLNPQPYLEASPLYNATKVKTPLLIFHGSFDFLPQRLANNFHDQIQAGGGAVNLMNYRFEGHGLSSFNNQLIAAQAQIAWFNQYLATPQT